jgi:photosystem II stability/assembly factor-like uncharacterized protein
MIKHRQVSRSDAGTRFNATAASRCNPHGESPRYRLSGSRAAALLLALLCLFTGSEVFAQSGVSGTAVLLPGRDPFGPGINLWAVDMLHADTAIAVGDGGIAKKTEDGGRSWITDLHADSNSTILLGISFIDSSTAAAVGLNGTILRTTDAGTIWRTQTSKTVNALYGVSFVDTATGTAVGDHGLILRTTNGGSTWTKQDSGGSFPLLGVSFTDRNTGTVVGGGGKIRHTTNGGGTWTTQTSGVSNFLYGVSFTDANTGTVVGTGGIILRTTDGGSTWTPQSSGTTNYFYGVCFVDASTGIAVGSSGTIARTTDGGADWSILPPPTANNLYAVSMTDTSHVIIVGGGGSIVLLTDTGMVVTGVSGGMTSLPVRADLYQNYPNPFNPQTVIAFDLRASGRIKLAVLDLLGREVSVLFEGVTAAGHYEIPFNAADLSSGIYFYRLAGRDFSMVKKMIVIR